MVGSEGKGIRPLVKKECDLLISIPMTGTLDSLNSSVAAAVILFEAMRQSLTAAVPAKAGSRGNRSPPRPGRLRLPGDCQEDILVKLPRSLLFFLLGHPGLQQGSQAADLVSRFFLFIVGDEGLVLGRSSSSLFSGDT